MPSEAPGRIPELIQCNQDFDPDKGTDGKDFTVRKIDKFQDTIDHGVAKGDGGIDKADGQSVNHHLGQIDQGIGIERNIQRS